MSICWAPNSISPRSRAASCVYWCARRLKKESTVVGRQLLGVKLWVFEDGKKNEQNKGNLTFQLKSNETCSLGSIIVYSTVIWNNKKRCLETPGKRIHWTPWPEFCAAVPSPTPAFPAADAEMSKMVGMQTNGKLGNHGNGCWCFFPWFFTSVFLENMVAWWLIISASSWWTEHTTCFSNLFRLTSSSDGFEAVESDRTSIWMCLNLW